MSRFNPHHEAAPVLAAAAEWAERCLVALFDMERLFEAFVGARLRRQWRGAAGAHVALQGPRQHFTVASDGPAFRMRPDIAVRAEGGAVVRVYDAKWKWLDAAAPNRGVSREDIYQMASYAGGYSCGRLALLYPRGEGAAQGLVEAFDLRAPGNPRVEVYALDLLALARGASLPAALGPPALDPPTPAAG